MELGQLNNLYSRKTKNKYIMQRWDIINHLIKVNDYKNYLEIGYYKGWSFDRINDNWINKTAVDPNPSKYLEMEEWEMGSWHEIERDGRCGGPSHFLHKQTSDDFFKEAQVFGVVTTWGTIFIDGLHEASQVERDIHNSLKHLSEGGTIVLHDMLPPTFEHTTTGDVHGNWNGDCYKALLAFIRDDIFGNYTVRVVNSDWGCGIIQRNEFPLETNIDFESYNKAIDDFNYFQENKDKLFNIITPEEFLALYSKDK